MTGLPFLFQLSPPSSIPTPCLLTHCLARVISLTDPLPNNTPQHPHPNPLAAAAPTRTPVQRCDAGRRTAGGHAARRLQSAPTLVCRCGGESVGAGRLRARAAGDSERGRGCRWSVCVLARVCVCVCVVSCCVRCMFCLARARLAMLCLSLCSGGVVRCVANGVIPGVGGGRFTVWCETYFMLRA